MEVASLKIWKEFEVQATRLLSIGYNLPHSLQVKAIHKLDADIGDWKQYVTRKEKENDEDEDEEVAYQDPTYEQIERISSISTVNEEEDDAICEKVCDTKEPVVMQDMKQEETVEVTPPPTQKRCRPRKPNPNTSRLKVTTRRRTKRKIKDVETEDDEVEEETDIGKDRNLDDDDDNADALHVFQDMEEQDDKVTKKRVRKKTAKTEQKVRGRKPGTRNGSSNLPRYFCNICNKNIVGLANYRKHMLIHKEGPMQCDLCDKTFQSPAGLSLHKKMHDPQIACSHCDYRAPNQSYLKRHEDVKHFGHDESRKRHICHICSARYYKSSSLKDHLKTHCDEKEHQCPHCQHRTHSDKLLATHIKNVHSADNPLMCSTCGFVTKYQNSLIQHQRRHNDEKLFKCEKCDYSSVDKSSLHRHRLVHTPQRQHECKICNKRFQERSHLKRHMVIHTGAKDFVCEYCCYSCNVHSNLRKHLIKVHNVTLPWMAGRPSPVARTFQPSDDILETKPSEPTTNVFFPPTAVHPKEEIPNPLFVMNFDQPTTIDYHNL